MTSSNYEAMKLSADTRNGAQNANTSVLAGSGNGLNTELAQRLMKKNQRETNQSYENKNQRSRQLPPSPNQFVANESISPPVIKSNYMHMAPPKSPNKRYKHYQGLFRATIF